MLIFNFNSFLFKNNTNIWLLIDYDTVISVHSKDSTSHFKIFTTSDTSSTQCYFRTERPIIILHASDYWLLRTYFNDVLLHQL